MDALANALGPAFQAAAVPGRVAVAMSGGVDSAVALLRAGRERDRGHSATLARPARSRRRARLLLARGRARGPGDMPPAGSPARDPRPAGGVPPRGRRAVRPRLRGRRDAEPLHPLQRQLPLRRAARVRRTGRRGAARDRALRAHRRAPGSAASRPRGRSGEGSVLHAGASRSALPRAALVSARRAEQGRRPAPRPRAPGSRRRLARRARRRASSPAATTATSSGGTGSPPRTARSWTRTVASSAGTPASGASRRVSAAGSASLQASPVYALRSEPRTNTVVVGPRAALATKRGSRSRTAARPGRPRGGEAALPLAGVGADVTPTDGGFRLRLDAPAHGVAAGQAAVLYEGDVIVGAGTIVSDPAETLRGPGAFEPTGE